MDVWVWYYEMSMGGIMDGMGVVLGDGIGGIMDVWVWYYEIAWMVLRDRMGGIKRWYGWYYGWYGCGIKNWYGWYYDMVWVVL